MPFSARVVSGVLVRSHGLAGTYSYDPPAHVNFLPDIRPRSEERAYTIVEIVVAVLILSIILGGVIWMIAGAGKSSQRSDIRQKMSAAAGGLAQQVRSNKDWLEALPQCKREKCSLKQLEKYRYRPKTSSDPKFESDIVITPIDSPIDNVSSGPGGAAVDKDHIVPDMYRIAVTVWLSEAEQEIWGKQEAFNLVSTVDATQLGKGTGSLTVQVCRVANQVDERMAIAGCKEKAQQLEMRYQPPCAMDKTLTMPKVVADGAAGKMLPLSCNAAIAETKNIKSDLYSPGSVDVRPMPDQDFEIVPVDGGAAFPRDRSMADKASGDKAAWTFTGLGTGDYQIKLKNVKAGLELWESHVVPQDLKVSIQSNQEAKALVILRPVQGLGQYTVAFSRMVYHYTLMMRTKVMFNETPDPVHQAVIHTTTTYKYLEAKLTATVPMPGASWNGYIAMEPKPFDRYRHKGSKIARQYIKPVYFGQPAVTFSAATGSPMPTGLYSRPEQLSLQQKGMYGQFDKEIPFRGANFSINQIYDREGVPIPIFNFHLGQGKMLCVPGLKCGNNYVYLNEKGVPNSSMLFNDAADGECYITSAVPQVPLPLAISGGLEQDGTGLPGGDRCERDFMINGMRIYNFLPDRFGQDGKTVLWRSSMTQLCVPADQCVPILFDPDRTMVPNGGTVVPSTTPTPALPTPLRTDPSPIIRSSDAAYAAACGLTWGAGCAAVPPPSSMPALSVFPALALMMPPIPEPSAADAKKIEACQDYMKVYENTMNNVLKVDADFMSSQGFEPLDCNPQCPKIGAETPYANQPIRYFTGQEGDAFGGVDAADFGGFSKAGTGIPICAATTPSLSIPQFSPPIAPPVEAPPFTGPNPDTGGVPGVPIDFPLPVVPGGSSAANGVTGL